MRLIAHAGAGIALPPIYLEGRVAGVFLSNHLLSLCIGALNVFLLLGGLSALIWAVVDSRRERTEKGRERSEKVGHA